MYTEEDGRRAAVLALQLNSGGEECSVLNRFGCHTVRSLVGQSIDEIRIRNDYKI